MNRSDVMPAATGGTLLKRGSLIGVASVAAAEPVNHSVEFQRGVDFVRSLGFNVSLAPHVLRKSGFVSAAPEQVGREINALFENADCAAILCAGGGITANAVLPFLDFDLIRRNPKPIVGVSNPSGLLNGITTRSGIVTFHGPSVIWDFGDPKPDPTTVSSFMSVLQAGHAVIAPIADWLVPGVASGRLIGGNLTSICQLIGSEYEPEWASSILFWEDVDEDAAHIAGMLEQLRQRGVLDAISGMIVGELVDCEPVDGVSPRDVVESFTRALAIPVVYGIPAGHTRVKYTLPIGSTIALNPDVPYISAQVPYLGNGAR